MDSVFGVNFGDQFSKRFLSVNHPGKEPEDIIFSLYCETISIILKGLSKSTVLC